MFVCSVNQPQPTNQMQTPKTETVKFLKIVSRHASVLEALEASGMDISYNPESARQDAARLECNNRHFEGVKEAWICEDGSIRYPLKCNDGLRLINTFEPFMSCLDDSPFTACVVNETEIQIHTALTFPKSQRKALAALEGISFM